MLFEFNKKTIYGKQYRGVRFHETLGKKEC